MSKTSNFGELGMIHYSLYVWNETVLVHGRILQITVIFFCLYIPMGWDQSVRLDTLAACCLVWYLSNLIVCGIGCYQLYCPLETQMQCSTNTLVDMDISPNLPQDRYRLLLPSMTFPMSPSSGPSKVSSPSFTNA